MKTLKPVEYYINQEPGMSSTIFFRKFIEDGIDLTIEEGLFLGSLEYTGLQGAILMMEKGIPKRIKVHPFVEACYEFLLAEVTYTRFPIEAANIAASLGMTLVEFKEEHSRKSEMVKNLIEKFGVPIAPIQAAIKRGFGIHN